MRSSRSEAPTTSHEETSSSRKSQSLRRNKTFLVTGRNKTLRLRPACGDGESWELVSSYLGRDDHDSFEEWIVKALTIIIKDTERLCDLR